jgi:CubicO group peptidase (beta-lactamase class C family)
MSESIRAGTWGNIHAVLIERRGMLVYEAYFAGADQRWGQDLGHVDFEASHPHDLRSITKSITATLLAIALADCGIPSIDTPLVEILPDRAHTLAGPKSSITLHHLLTMSSGLEWDESLPYSDARNDERRMTGSQDPVGFVLSRALIAEPGSTWNYSGGSTQVLASIVEHCTGRGLMAYASEMLFRPLAVDGPEWLGDLAGAPAAASGLRMRARDLAKFGSLYLNAGRWDGVEVVPSEWVSTALEPHVESPDPSAPPFVVESGYGYQWWINTFDTAGGSLEVYAAVGNGGQRLLVIPGLEMAVTILAGFQRPTSLLDSGAAPPQGNSPVGCRAGVSHLDSGAALLFTERTSPALPSTCRVAYL